MGNLLLIDLVISMPHNKNMLAGKIDRTQIILAKKNELDNMDAEYWAAATVKEKLQTITYLRECFYGE